jgi:hypothetical protein
MKFLFILFIFYIYSSMSQKNVIYTFRLPIFETDHVKVNTKHVEYEPLQAAEMVTSYFQANLRQNFTRIEIEMIKNFLQSLLDTRNRAYKAPQYWHSRQG